MTIEIIAHQLIRRTSDRCNWRRALSTPNVWDIIRKPFIVPEMTLKIDQGHWRWHSSIGHISLLLVICSNHVSILYSFWDIQRFLNISVEGYLTCEFMYDLYILLKSTDPGLSFCRWLYRSIFIHCYTAIPGKAICSVRWCVTVVQGHRNSYQSKARMRLPISLPL